MEENWRSIVYFYLARGEQGKKNRLSTLKFIEWKETFGEEWIEFYRVPEYYRGKREWDTEKLSELLRKKLSASEADGYYVQPALCRLLGLEERLPPMFLLKKVLEQNGCWENLIYVGCADGTGSRMDEEGQEALLFSLLDTYLPRVNHFMIISGRPRLYEDFMDYIYQEYGIPAVCTERLPECAAGRRTVILDSRYGFRPVRSALPAMASYIDLWSEEEKQRHIECGRKDVNYLGTVKFLDTLVKNRYNTIVNRT